ncbi:histone H2B.3-like [Cucumis melo var. makuwa]|uniref:Histone H2B.3-like n=1 Tax=Cucumis melo var. makuwa TaxID=1194695 RepID=A0A5A7SNC7_CUCMM|nr:histone H2B.3-like [Cucumis melo var. makuwa]
MVRVVEVEDVTNLLNGLLKMEDKHLHTLASDALVTYADLVALTIQLHSRTLLDQLFAKGKNLRNFKKYNPQTFDGSLQNSTKVELWLTSIETIFYYMKSIDNQEGGIFNFPV